MTEVRLPHAVLGALAGWQAAGTDQELVTSVVEALNGQASNPRIGLHLVAIDGRCAALDANRSRADPTADAEATLATHDHSPGRLWRALASPTRPVIIPSTGARRFVLDLPPDVDRAARAEVVAVAEILAATLDARVARRRQALRRRLGRLLTRDDSTVTADSADALRDVAEATRASGSRLFASETAGGPLRLLAETVGARTAADAGALDAPVRAADRIVALTDASAWPVALELTAIASDPFGVDDALLAEEGVRLLGLWLSGVSRGLATRQGGARPLLTPAAFASRLDDELTRSTRFGSEAGLLLIDPMGDGRGRHLLTLDAVIVAVRSQLRGTDAMGRLEDGTLGALVVHTTTAGVRSVLARIRERLAGGGPRSFGATPIVGCGVFPSAGPTGADVIGHARDDLQRQRSGVLPGLRAPTDPWPPPPGATPLATPGHHRYRHARARIRVEGR